MRVTSRRCDSCPYSTSPPQRPPRVDPKPDAFFAPHTTLAPLESAAAHSNCAVVAIDEGSDRALAHASSLTLGSERICWVWDRDLLVGLRTRLACLKNKLAAPGAVMELEVRYALGPTLFTAEPVREVGEVPESEVLELPKWRARSAAG